MRKLPEGMTPKENKAIAEGFALTADVLELLAQKAVDATGLMKASLRGALFLIEEIEQGRDYWRNDCDLALAQLLLDEFREDQAKGQAKQ